MNLSHISIPVRRACAIFALVFSGSGCVSFTGVEEPGDALVDEVNAPFARQAEEVYKARRSFKRRVAIVEGEGVDAFLAKAKWGKNSQIPKTFKNAEELCSHYEVRRSLLLEARRNIVQWLGTLRDFELINRDCPIAEIAVEMPDDVYRLFYKIEALSLNDDGAFESTSRHDRNRKVMMRHYKATAIVYLNLVAPDGRSVFTFAALGKGEDVLFSGSGRYYVEDGELDGALLTQAVSESVKNATQRYARKFAPPLYVTSTCQNGQFAKLNAGREYGLVVGANVKFFGHRSGTALDGSKTVEECLLGTGVIGCEKRMGSMKPQPSMIDRDGTWVFVNDFDEDKRRVFKWCSARVE